MVRFFRACVLSLTLLLLCPPMMQARDWADAAAQVEDSIVFLTHPAVLLDHGKLIKATSTCTGFSTGSGYFFTAYHCLNNGTAKDLRMDGQPARVLFGNEKLDIAVITGNVRKPALHFSRRHLRKGDQVATLGHAYGFRDTLFRAGYVAHPSMALGEEFGPNYTGLWLIFDAPYIGGMSGGPVFTMDGLVVGIVQQSDEYSGFGLTMETVLAEAGFFWDK